MDSSQNPIQMPREQALLVTGVLPAFAVELERLLTDVGEPGLAAQVPSLRMFELCSCGDDFCSTFYTRPTPQGAYGPGHRNVVLEPYDGTVILDVVADEIACVEILDRPEIREKLDTTFL